MTQPASTLLPAGAYAELIGDPVAHSKSPVIHRFWLDRLGIAADYRAKRVGADGLAAYFAARRADPAWLGCNITMPHKIAALDHVANAGDLAQSIGATNTVLRDGDRLVATNTDAAGFYAPLADIDLAGAPVAVIGAGGAARAVLFALARCGVGPVTLVARNPLKAAMLLSALGVRGATQGLDAPLPPARLLVNASPLGMAGHDAFAGDLDRLPPDAIVYDLVYDPLVTPLIAAAEARGLDTIDGLEMLVGQAAVAFELLFGAAAPREHDGELRALLTP
jgi:shikimate dehydrogenase